MVFSVHVVDGMVSSRVRVLTEELSSLQLEARGMKCPSERVEEVGHTATGSIGHAASRAAAAGEAAAIPRDGIESTKEEHKSESQHYQAVLTQMHRSPKEMITHAL